MKLLGKKQLVIWSLIMTAAIEIFTVIMRFALDVQSTRDTASNIGVLTCGIRIHHGCFGVIIVIIALLLSKRRLALSRWILVAGIALICSDLIHHFAVLWPIVGSHEFDFAY